MAEQGRAQDNKKGALDGSTASAGPPTAMRALQDEGSGSEVEERVEGGDQDQDGETTPSTSTACSATSSSPLLRLPPELFAGILDHLPLYSHRTLANLCLVCRALLPTAREALYGRRDFSILALGEDAWVLAPRNVKLLRSLRANAHLPPLVKDLECLTSIADAHDVQDIWGISIFTTSDADGWKEKWLRKFTKKNGIDIEATMRELFTLVGPHLLRLSVSSTPEDIYDFEPLLARVSFSKLTSELKAIAVPTPPTSLPGLQTLSLTSDKRVDASLLPFTTWLTSSSHASLRALTLPFTHTFPHDAFLTSFPHLVRLTLVSAKYAFLADALPQYPPERLLPPLPASLTVLTLGCLSRSPSPAITLPETFLFSLRAPNLVALTLTAPTFAARVFAQLVADTERLPRLRVLNAAKVYSDLEDCEAHEGWGQDGREELQKACEGRGVKLLLPLPRNVGRRRW
ncbi:hypothetical protein JCM10213_003350 [Rhodosporidiobolus nylandii]